VLLADAEIAPVLTLTTLARSGQAVPEVATEWEPDSTGTIWHFKFRPGIAFSDGSPSTEPHRERSSVRSNTSNRSVNRARHKIGGKNRQSASHPLVHGRAGHQ